MPIDQDTAKRREAIDKIVDDILDRARKMIANDVPAETAFRLAISWELEIAMLDTQVKLRQMLLELMTT
jgi:hypothetical protein